MDFDDEFDALAAVAYRVAFRILGDRAVAEEVAQEALTRAYVRWTTVRSYARAWVCRVATNESIGILRKRREVGDQAAGPVDEMAATVERLELQRLLLGLPRRPRQVLAMRYLADLPEADVARGLGCSIGTVKRHAHRGIATLSASLAAGLTEEIL